VIETEAAVLRASGSGSDGIPVFEALQIEPVQLDEPGPGEALVSIAVASICHSDLSVLTGDRPRPLPMVLGHEASGVVAATGPWTTRVRVGDHVLLSYVPACGRCRHCAEGRPALCEPGNRANAEGRLLTGSRPFRDAGGALLHQHLGLSAFSRMTVAAQESLVVLPEAMPLDHAALLGCAVVTGVGAVINTAGVEPGATVAVFGLGGVGLSVVMGAQLAGAAMIVGVDVAADKLARARELGATDGLLADATVVERVLELSAGGVDYAFDATGVPLVLEQAYRSTRRGGVAVALGLSHPDARISISPAELVSGERSLRGSYMGTTVPARDVSRLTQLYLRGQLPVELLVGSRIRMADIPHGFERLHAGVVGRQLVEISTADG
jgi:alcohol dehydrogenase